MALSDIVHVDSILRETGQMKEDHRGKIYFRHLIAKLPIKKTPKHITWKIQSIVCIKLLGDRR